MEALTATAGLIAVGAITPGPNNLIVLREAARGGWKRALPAAIGIVCGGVALVVVVVAGAGGLFDSDGLPAAVMGVGACLLLAALGLGSILGSAGPRPRSDETRPTSTARSFGSLFVFQFLNPKAWLLVVAAVGSIGTTSGPGVALVQLSGLFLLIPALSLALWASAGGLLMRQLDRGPTRIWFDRLAGGLLIAFALLLLRGALDAL